MRKAVSILLVVLLLFNALGFYGVLMGLRLQSMQNLVNRLDQNDYSDKETITLKIPVSLPYTAADLSYERVDGEIEFNGEFFHLVKQKLQNDTLYVVCIRDCNGKQITQALHDYVKTFSDRSDTSKNTAKIFQTIIKDYLPVTITIESTFGWNTELTAQTRYPVSYSAQHAQRVVQPPEAIA